MIKYNVYRGIKQLIIKYKKIIKNFNKKMDEKKNI
jgi:hypothetical protein